MLFVSNSSMTLIGTHDFTDATLTIASLGSIVMVQVSWNFYSSDDDHSVAASIFLILHECCAMNVPIPYLVLLY